MAVVAWIGLTFDPNAYKPKLVEFVQQRYQRMLTLDGDIRITWFPSIGAAVGKVSLSERASDNEFAGADRVQASLELLPLLRGRVVIGEIGVSRLRATLVTYKDGTRNIDDLVDPGAAPRAEGRPVGSSPPDTAGGISLNIGRIVIENGQLGSRDERTGSQFSLSSFALTTGRIGGSQADPFSLSAAVQASEPKLSLRIEARGQLLVDSGQKRFGASSLAASVTGSVGTMPIDLRLELARLLSAPGALQIDKLKLVARITGASAGEQTVVEANLPALAARDGGFAGANIGVTVDRTSATDRLNVRIGIPLDGRLSATSAVPIRVAAAEIKADMEGKLSGMTVQGSARGQFIADIAASRYEMSKFALKATLFGLDAPVRDLTLTLDGGLLFDLSEGARPAMAASGDGRLNESTLRARASRATAAAPLAFDIEAYQFDLDRYRPAAAKRADTPGGAPKPVAAGTGPIDFGFLDGLDMSGAVRVGMLKANGIQANNVRVEVKATGGRLDLAPITAALYSGRLEAALSLVNAKPPRIVHRFAMSGVQVGPLLAAAAKIDLIEGRGDVKLDVTTQGASTDAFKRSLNGSASINLSDGALKGVDIVGALREAQTRAAQLTGSRTRASAASDRTGFSELRASFGIRDGVARGTDLSIKSPLLRVAGEGAIDIGGGTIDYKLRPIVIGSLSGQGARDSSLLGVTVPVRITGPLAKPQFEFDYQAILLGSARNLQQRAIDLLLPPGGSAQPGKADARPTPADLLKGLLGR